MRISSDGSFLEGLARRAAEGPAILRDEMTQAADAGAKTVALSAIAKAPVRTGRLRRSISSEVLPITSDVQSLVQATAPYARYVEEGTGIYGPKGQPIFAKNSPFMVFQVGGQWVRVKGIRGMKAQPFMKPAFEEKREAVVQMFRDAVARALRRVIG